MNLKLKYDANVNIDRKILDKHHMSMLTKNRNNHSQALSSGIKYE